MPGQDEVRAIVEGAYGARRTGDVDAVLSYFADDVDFCLAGSPEASPVPMRCGCHDTLRAAMTQLVATFELTDQTFDSVVVDGDRAAVHWRGTVRSTRTGETAETEVVDLLVLRDGKIAGFKQFMDTALAAKLA